MGCRRTGQDSSPLEALYVFSLNIVVSLWQPSPNETDAFLSASSHSLTLSAPFSPLSPPNKKRKTDFQNTQGIIFVVDSNDRERVSEAREELQRMLNEDELRDALLLVFANKQDLPNAMNAAEITDKLGLHSLRQRTWYIQATCATSGDGLYEGLEWVSGVQRGGVGGFPLDILLRY